MSNESFSIQFTKKQVEYFMRKLGIEDQDEAIEVFMTCFSKENVEPNKIILYVNKLMDKDGVK